MGCVLAIAWLGKDYELVAYERRVLALFGRRDLRML